MKRAIDRETAIRAVLHPLAQRRPLAISPAPLRVAEYIVSIDVTRVRLPAEESGDQWLCCVTAEMFKISWSINKERSHAKELLPEVSATTVKICFT